MELRESTKIFKALADEGRVRMLKLLLEKDICVCEMQEVFPLSESQVSRSLKMLMDAGLLRRWREGKCVVYVADRENSPQLCLVVMHALANSLNDCEVVRRDREALQEVIARKVRETRK